MPRLQCQQGRTQPPPYTTGRQEALITARQLASASLKTGKITIFSANEKTHSPQPKTGHRTETQQSNNQNHLSFQGRPKKATPSLNPTVDSCREKTVTLHTIPLAENTPRRESVSPKDNPSSIYFLQGKQISIVFDSFLVKNRKEFNDTDRRIRPSQKDNIIVLDIP